MRAAGKPVAGFPGGIGDVGTRAPHDGMGGDVSECGMGVLRSGGGTWDTARHALSGLTGSSTDRPPRPL